MFREEADKILYLLLHYEEGHWGSPKGHQEKGETIEETARREIREETGLTDIQFINGFQEQNEYFFTSQGSKIFKTVDFRLAETQTKEIKLSAEHIGYEWLTYEKAMGKITFKNEAALLKKANDFLVSRR